MTNKNTGSDRATINDVAREAGVSIKTVSRVMNRAPNVSDATREKVLVVANRLSYEPDPSARMLAGKRSYSLGVIYENPHEFSYLKRLLDGAFESCGSLGYSLLLKPCGYPNQDIATEVGQFIKQTRVDGVILAPPLCDDVGITRLLRQISLPFVQIAPIRQSRSALTVSSDDLDASYHMTRHVIALGHRRIGFIKGHPLHAASRLRYEGYRAALQHDKIRLEPALVREGYFEFESGQKAADQMLSLSRPPTAIIASNDDMAAGAMFAARERGYQVPEDISVTGFDDTPTAAHIWPPLTTVRQPIAAMAAAAATALVEWVAGGTPPPVIDEFKCELILRRSTTNAPV